MHHDILHGVINFMEQGFSEHKELFESLSSHQSPHTLFVGCSDSRVVPSLITQTRPGELFIVRNVANIVPPYRLSTDYAATTSAIEYALNALPISQAVICGHSNCGGCHALYAENLSHLPNLAKWLELASDVRSEVLAYPNLTPAKREWLTERLNIINSYAHLLDYPGVRERVAEGALKIYGWHYIIETGEIFNYISETGEFALISK